MRIGPLSVPQLMSFQTASVFVFIGTILTFEPLIDSLLFVLLLNVSYKIGFEDKRHMTKFTEKVPL